MGCTSAKHVSSVPSEEEEEGAGKAKAYQNGDAFGDQYKLKTVEEVKYMRSGDEDGVTARNQDNLVRGERREEHRVTARNQENLLRGERGEEHRVTACNQENLEKSASSNRSKSQKDGSGVNSQRANIHTSESQQEFFRMLDEKIEKGPDYSSEEEKDIT